MVISLAAEDATGRELPGSSFITMEAVALRSRLGFTVNRVGWSAPEPQHQVSSTSRTLGGLKCVSVWSSEICGSYMNRHQKRARLRKLNASQKSRPKRTQSSGNKEAAADLSGSAEQTVNKRFNRVESKLENYYITTLGSEEQQKYKTQGWIKCKLVHGHGYSVIVPDQLFLRHKSLKAIQPIGFLPNLISKYSATNIQCALPIFISCGNKVIVQFSEQGLVSNLADGSQIYRCTFVGPPELHEYATTDAEFGANRVPYLHIHHHTMQDVRQKILDSQFFRTGGSNIQGTSKKLRNVGYAYFTYLNVIRTENDLKMIAMAGKGIIELRRDGFSPPNVLDSNYLETFRDDILQLEVYASDPTRREASIDVWIDSTLLAPQHIYRHFEDGSMYYQFAHYLIHRVGTEPGRAIEFDAVRHIHRQSGVKSFDYVVVGDCTTLEGLAAPYDEEDTTHVMKVERLSGRKGMLAFWFTHANRDLFTSKNVETQQFEQVSLPKS